MKKPVICLIALLLIFNIVCDSAKVLADHNPAYSIEMLCVARNILTELDIWRDYNQNDAYLTRIEAAEIFVRLSQLAPPTHWSFSYFADVSCESYDSGWINTMLFNFDVSEEDFQTRDGMYFRPYDPISYYDFIKWLCSTMGWYHFIKPENFGELGLYPVPKAETSLLTKNDAIIILYNTMKLPMLIQMGFGLPEYSFESFDWTRYCHNVEIFKGYCKKIDENTLEIDGVKYRGRVSDDNFTQGYVCGGFEDYFYKSGSKRDPDKLIKVQFCYPVSSPDFDMPDSINASFFSHFRKTDGNEALHGYIK